MSWISTNTTTDKPVYTKQISQDVLSFYHGFSKTPVEPELDKNGNATGYAATTLANATTKSGHTVLGGEVWASELPWFGFAPNKDVASTRVSGITNKNDLIRINDVGKDYIYIGKGGETFDKNTWDTVWQEITLTNGMELANQYGDKVLRYYEKQRMQALESDNNAGIDSKGYATRLFVDESTHTAVTTVGQGSVIPQFAAATDSIKNGLTSSILNPVVYIDGTQKVAGTHFYDYNVSGTILWDSNVKNKNVTITCFRYIGKSVTAKTSEIESTVTTHSNEISEIKDKLGLGDTGTEGTPTLSGRVAANETALRVLLGLENNAEVVATESIATTAASAATTAISTSLAANTDGSIGKAIADAKQEALNAIDAIQHFSVVVVPDGQTIDSVSPLVENTIYLVKDANAAEGTYIEYIAYKPAGSATVVTEKIGSTAIDLTGYTTVGAHNELAARVTALDTATTGRVAVVEGKVKTLEETTVPAAIATAQGYTDTKIADELKDGGSIATAINTAKQAAIDSAKVTLTAGTGITIPNSGTPQTAFTVSVNTDVIATKQSVDDVRDLVTGVSQTVADIQTELSTGSVATGISEAKAAAKAAQDTADEKVASVTGPTTGLVTVSGDKNVTITVSGTIATKTDAANAASTAITTSLAGTTAGTIGAAVADAKKAGTDAASALNTAKAQSLAQTGTLSGMFSVTTAGTVGTGITGITISDTGLSTAIAAAKSGAEQTAATALSTARDEIRNEISTAVSGLETKLTTGTDSLAGKVTALEGSVKTINETTIPNAITTAQNGAVTTVKALSLSATDSDDASKVTVTLGGTVEKPTITVTSSDIASAQTLATLKSTVETHISEAAGLYLSVEKVNTLPADADAKANKIYLVPVDTEAGRAQNIHTEYIWTNGQWEVIGTTAIDMNSLEAAAEAAQGAADKAQAAADKAQGEVDAVEAAIAAMDADLTVNGISVKQVDGKVTELSEALITASVPDKTTSVVGNIAYVGSTKHVIAPDKFQTAAQMPTTLKSWVADLSNLTNGGNMFKDCGLTTFVGDLSSLTTADNMFYGCTLDAESLEILSENLPTVAGGTIDIGASTNATAEVIATIKGKGWTLKSNGAAL